MPKQVVNAIKKRASKSKLLSGKDQPAEQSSSQPSGGRVSPGLPIRDRSISKPELFYSSVPFAPGPSTRSAPPTAEERRRTERVRERERDVGTSGRIVAEEAEREKRHQQKLADREAAAAAREAAEGKGKGEMREEYASEADFSPPKPTYGDKSKGKGKQKESIDTQKPRRKTAARSPPMQKSRDRAPPGKSIMYRGAPRERLEDIPEGGSHSSRGSGTTIEEE
ncbi:MAG: hypothetical protein Q9202_006130 [Teloschistes flavicans]